MKYVFILILLMGITSASTTVFDNPEDVYIINPEGRIGGGFTPPTIEPKETIIETIESKTGEFVEHVKKNKTVYWGISIFFIICLLVWCYKEEKNKKCQK